MSFCSFTLRTGRKDHRCETCGRITPKGEKSYAVAGTFEGDFNSYRQCIACKQLVDRLYASGAMDRGEAYILSELREIAVDAGEAWPPQVAEWDGVPSGPGWHWLQRRRDGALRMGHWSRIAGWRVADSLARTSLRSERRVASLYCHRAVVILPSQATLSVLTTSHAGGGR